MAPGAPVRGVPGLLPPYAMPQTARPRLAPSSVAAAEEPAALLPQSQSFETRFGGIVFLCNVALNLGLYGDFTQPLQPAVPVSPWRLLHTALGAAFGRAGRADALAHWLLLRDGGAAEPRLAGPWQLPGAALRAFDADERPWHGVVVSGVMELWHPAGFCLAHRLPRHELAPLLARLQRPRQAVVIHAVHAVHAVRAATPAPRLSLLLWPLLRARLRLGLGLGGPTSLRAAVALALPLPARVRVRSERVDLHFSLAALPLAVRMAGLDRDPGWLPAAGADIRFHFD